CSTTRPTCCSPELRFSCWYSPSTSSATPYVMRWILGRPGSAARHPQMSRPRQSTGSRHGMGLRKETTVRYRVRALTVSALAISLAVAGCAKNTGGSSSGSGDQQKQQAIIIDTKGKAPTPAPEVPGAKPGGTLEYMQDGAPE